MRTITHTPISWVKRSTPKASIARPLRVLYTINNLDTAGTKLVLADIVRGLDRRRFEPIIAVGRRSDSALERDLEQCCRIVELSLKSNARPRAGIATSVFARAESIRRAVDVVHSFDYSSDWSEGIAVRAAHKPWVVLKTNMTWGGRRWYARSALATRIVCMSSAQVDTLARWNAKLAFIPNGVDVERFANATPIPRGEIGLADDDVVLACVAHLVPVKRHEALIRALSEVVAFEPRVKLVLVGGGEPADHERIEGLARELGVVDRVRMLGGRRDVAEILKACDGKVLASEREGFGTALVEAMAAGLATVATRCGGPEDIVVDGETGWLVDAHGHAPLVDGMRRLCADRDRRQRFGQAGQLRARSNFGVASMVDRYAELYELVDAPRRARRAAAAAV